MNHTADNQTIEPSASSLVADAGASAKEQLGLAKPYPSGQSISVKGGLLPANLDEAARVAQLVARSTFVPTAFRDKPGDVLAAILYGLDLGLPPMQALQTIAVINGKPSVYGDGFLAVIYSLPAFKDHDEYFWVKGQRKDSLDPADLTDDTVKAVCVFTRKGRTKPVQREFSIANAKKASLWTKQGPWMSYPDRMLMFRARGFAGRDAFPDGLRGIVTAEEARDMPSETFEGSVVAMPQRISEVPATVLPVAAEAPVAVQAPVTPPPAPVAPEPTPAPPAPPSASILAGADRIATVARNASANSPGRSWWKFETYRGVLGYTWDAHLGLALETAHGSNILVALETEQDAQGKTRLVSLQPFADDSE